MKIYILRTSIILVRHTNRKLRIQINPPSSLSISLILSLLLKFSTCREFWIIKCAAYRIDTSKETLTRRTRETERDRSRSECRIFVAVSYKREGCLTNNHCIRRGAIDQPLFSHKRPYQIDVTRIELLFWPRVVSKPHRQTERERERESAFAQRGTSLGPTVFVSALAVANLCTCT